MAQPTVKLHWLEKSRAFRLVWLLEALHINYDVVKYHRDSNFRAPDSLRKVHPLGRSPLLEVQTSPDAKSKVLAESGFIFQWVLRNFDTKHILSNPEKKDEIDYYLFYAEGSLMPPLLIEYMLQKVKSAPIPWPLSYISHGISNKISNVYSNGETKSQLNFLEGELLKNNGFFVDGKLSAADIILSFPIQMAASIGVFDKKNYPHIGKWLDTLEKDESYKNAKNAEKRFLEDE